MLRGSNKQQIFHDEEDFEYFTDILKRFKAVSHYELYAYCFMGNHVHLLMRFNEEQPELVFRRIGAAFVYWYNLKYQRAGHLFQDRFKSEPVDSQDYLLRVLRYILRNPVAAGICRKPEEYKYSSAREYISFVEGVSDKAFIYELIDEASLPEYLNTGNDDSFLDVGADPRHGLTDSCARELIISEFGTLTPKPGKAKERDAIYNSIRRLYKAGVSIRQLSRLTGISKTIIEAGLK